MSYEELRELDREIKEAEDHLSRLREERRRLFDEMSAKIPPSIWYGGDPTHVKRFVCP